MDQKAENRIKDRVFKLIAEQLGIEPSDISEDDSLTDDLHMSATDISDFLEKLKNEGVDIDEIDFDEIDTVNDLTDSIALHSDW